MAPDKGVSMRSRRQRPRRKPAGQDRPTAPSFTPATTPFPGYRTATGRYYVSTIEDWLASDAARRLRGEVDLILTSPPFPLNRKKSYGNKTGDAYLKWLEELSPKLAAMLSERGSIVVELGNAWNAGEPTMSTLPVEALLAIKKSADLRLCQEFICHNPARLPSPIQYVNVERIRAKDSWTRLWWMSKVPKPKADNRRVLLPYSDAMRSLLKRKRYNGGARPSQHHIGAKSFLKDNGGAIAPSALSQDALKQMDSFLSIANTRSTNDRYLAWCEQHEVPPHPARMQPLLSAFFVSFLTKKGDCVLDPFAGSNTTGATSHALGRRWVSIEANAMNVDSSKTQFENLAWTGTVPKLGGGIK